MFYWVLNTLSLSCIKTTHTHYLRQTRKVTKKITESKMKGGKKVPDYGEENLWLKRLIFFSDLVS